MFSEFFTKSQIQLNGYDVTIYDFDDTRKQEFINNSIEAWRNAYISERVLIKRVEKMNSSREEELSILLPTRANIKSGEFGEILTYLLLSEDEYVEANCRPLKWRWKETQDMPMHGVDVVFMKCDDPDHPCADDYYVTNEAKAKATQPNQSQLHEAALHAVKDMVGRQAKTITLLRKRYSDDENYEMAKIVKRFAEPINTTSFKKEHNAIAIVDRVYLQKHKDDFNPKIIDGIEHIKLYIIPIAEMKSIYEQIYEKTLKS